MPGQGTGTTWTEVETKPEGGRQGEQLARYEIHLRETQDQRWKQNESLYVHWQGMLVMSCVPNLKNAFWSVVVQVLST